MKSIEIKGSLRTETGKKATRELRKDNGVPCVLYGTQKDENGNQVATHFTVPTEGLRNLVYTPHIYVVDLNIDGKIVNAIMKDIQFHPVTDKILHVDFYQIDESKPIVMEVPVKLEGLAEGVKAGGKLALQIRKLKVKALYNVIPERLVVDVTPLGLGKTIKVGELKYEGLELLNAKEAVVCAVKLTRAARGAQAAAGILSMKYLIVGLGNIGEEYRETRHNIGFMVLDALAKASNIVFSDGRYGATAQLSLKGRQLILLKPSTYMNLSGNAVRYWMQQEKIPLENVLIVVDDLALPFGTLRLKGKGSDAGHNGLKHIAATLGTQNYARLRFGIGNDFPKGGQIDFVLGHFDEESMKLMPERLEVAQEIIKSFCLAGLNITMNQYNNK